MKSLALLTSVVIGMLLACFLLTSLIPVSLVPDALAIVRATASAAPGGPLPGRSTPTPSTGDAPENAAPEDCTAIFPIDSIEAIEFGVTTATQLRAAFGEPVSVTGRPPSMRFEAGPCVLMVSLGIDEAQEVELQGYGTLGWVLDHYGPPDTAGIAQGNLTLPLADSAVLLYADAGLIALFNRDLSGLDRDTPVDSLFVRPAYALDDQLRRLNVEKVEWQPPI
ncbi:hypothetical protein [Aggregatilinea lenta]|uniref:hypothetical protein n=1 Tax=Aggregatilinea lenta TaxID=913108 RepID=UPI000E5BFAFC|nr:hypothetical protein [Aggregatilinea lenta]